MNIKANQVVTNIKHIKDLYVAPSGGDESLAIGGCYYYSSRIKVPKPLENIYLGPKYKTQDILKKLKNKKIKRDFVIKKNVKTNQIANFLKMGKIIARFDERMEFGARALGNRSILVDCREPDIKDILNTKIKLREKFRPFAASILEDDVSDFFIVNDKKDKFPNMNFVLKAKEITQKTYPSIVHVDGSSRIQSVNIKSNKKFYDLLKKFKDKFSCPMLLNTSMNIDEPICESPTDVINSFANTKIDCIVMQKSILKKKTI